jgi:L-seryl-tRNA(Ser) seleniumtransferase
MVDSLRVVNPDPRRALPSVSKLISRLGSERPDLPAWAVTEAARRVVEEARESLTRQLADADRSAPGDPGIESDDELAARAGALAEGLCRRHPRPVVNATGVVLHTNLGRSPLPPGAGDAVREVAAGYSDLELDLETGRRGSRLGALEAKLIELSGAEAGYACNNNAAAVMLALDTLARGREVIVSRGELVEIGGSFRVPDIMERAGVRLVEVGTTNRTHARDYERAIGPDTALLLKVHRSNFSQSGFVTEVDLEELVSIGQRRGLAVMEDLGSGTLLDLTGRGFPAEAFAPSRIATGADVVCFSGDKLLGGPQAGILLGKRASIDAMRGNPLARALRLDKMCLAALDWTVTAYLDGRAEAEIPVVRQLLAPVPDLEIRARSLAARLAGLLKDSAEVSVESDRAPVGGGTLPGFELDTWVVALRTKTGAAKAAAALRTATTPVLTRVRDDAVLFDLRTLEDADATRVEAAVSETLGPDPSGSR